MHSDDTLRLPRSRSDFTGSTRRMRTRMAKRARGRDATEWDAQQRGASVAPKPPLIGVLVEDLVDDMPEPAAIYGQYPRTLIAKLLPYFGCERRKILHVCSGILPRGEGIRVDIRPAAMPDILADGRCLPLADGSVQGVMIDPPYTPHYARELYGVAYPRPSHLLREAVRVVRPCGLVVIVHYITPRPPQGARFMRVFALSTGFNMPVRAVSLYQRDQAGLFGTSATSCPNGDL